MAAPVVHWENGRVSEQAVGGEYARSPGVVEVKTPDDGGPDRGREDS